MSQPLTDLPAKLETERLLIRPYCVEDAPAYLAVCLRNKTHLLPYEHGNPALAIEQIEDAEQLMQQFADDWVARRAFLLGAWEKTNGDFAAQIYLGVVNRELPEFNIGYFVDGAKQGRGFVTEALTSVLSFAFDHLCAHRLTLHCNETNARSCRVAERAGFQREGHKRQTHRNILRADGGYSGDYMYGLLVTEYRQLVIENACSGSNPIQDIDQVANAHKQEPVSKN